MDRQFSLIQSYGSFLFPIERVARVVDVSKEEVNDQGSAISKDGSDQSKVSHAESQQPAAIQSEISVRLTDGSILVFEPLEVRDGTLFGTLVNLRRGSASS